MKTVKEIIKEMFGTDHSIVCNVQDMVAVAEAYANQMLQNQMSFNQFRKQVEDMFPEDKYVKISVSAWKDSSLMFEVYADSKWTKGSTPEHVIQLLSTKKEVDILIEVPDSSLSAEENPALSEGLGEFF